VTERALQQLSDGKYGTKEHAYAILGIKSIIFSTAASSNYSVE